MKKLALLIISCLFAFTSITAQEDMIVVLSCKGDATYAASDERESQAIVPGLTIPIAGNIFINKDAQVKLIVNQKAVLLSGNGRYKVQDIYDANTKKSMSFSSRFWKFVTAGMSPSSKKTDLSQYHKQYMSIHGGIKGYAPNSDGLKLTTPIYGNIAASTINVAWEHQDQLESYEVNVYDQNRTTIVHEIVENYNMGIDISHFEPNTQYTLEIKSIGDGQQSNTVSSFIYNPSGKTETIKRLDYLSEYDTQADEKLWMEAIVLEMEEYYYDAYILFDQLFKASPDNLLIKKSYANFLVRQNNLERAIAISTDEK